MLAQDTANQLAPVFALITGVAVAFGPLAIGVTKLVDGLRLLVDRTPETPWPGWVWIGAAMVISIAACLGFQINVADALIQQIPALNGSTILTGVWGQIVTGVGVAGMASYWHETMALKAAATAAHTAAATK